MTNWSCGYPIWHNGDDVQDLLPAALRAAASTGTLQTTGVRCIEYRNPTAPHRQRTTVGLAAVELVVRSP